MEETMQTSRFNLFRNRNFLLVFLSFLLSAPGYYIFLMGAEWLMLSLTDNRFYFGMLFFAASVPRLLFMIVGGIAADRFAKKNILFLSDTSRAVLIGILIVTLLSGALQPWHLLVLSALFGVSDAFTYPASSSLMPEVLAPDDLQQGNAMLQMTSMLSPIIGPAIGGALIVAGGYAGVFSVSAVMLMGAAGCVIFTKAAMVSGSQLIDRQSPLTELKEGFHYVKTNQLILSIMLLSFFVNFFLTGPTSMSVALLARDVFQTNAFGLTILEGALGVGSLIAAAGLVLLKNLKNPGYTVIVSLIILSAVFMLYGSGLHFWVSAAAILIMGICLQFTNIPIFTMIQQTTDRRMIGRVMSIMSLASTGLIPVSYMVTSALLGVGVSIQLLCLIGGAVVMVIGIFSLKNKQLLALNRYNEVKQEETI